MRRPGIGIGRRAGLRTVAGSAAAPAVAAPVNSVAPVIAGTVTIGGSVTITAGTWSGAPTLTYTLVRGGVADGTEVNRTEAQAEAYVFVAADIGPSIVWRETATNAGGSDSEDSNALSFSPTQLTNVRLWLRADLGVTLNGADVDIWADQSGAGNDFSAAAAANQPLFIGLDAGFNQKPAVQFDGGSEWLRDTAFSWGAAPTAMSVWCVCRIDTLVTLDRVWTYAAANPVFLRENTGPLAIFSGNAINSSSAWAGTKAWGGVWDGATQWLYDGGTQVDTDPNANAMPADGAVFALGASTTGTTTGAVSISEVIAMRAVATAGERADLDAYFSFRYGV
jgi:hypothetical protein